MLNPTIRDPRRYNLPTLQQISEHSPCYLPMCYPLIFPHGEQAWHALIPLGDTNLTDNVNLLRVMRTNKFRDMDAPVLREWHSLNIMLFSCKIVMTYSHLFSTPVDYARNSVSMLGSVLKLIVSISHVLIKLNYVLNVIMGYKMQLVQGLMRMRIAWAVKSFILHLSQRANARFLKLYFCEEFWKVARTRKFNKTKVTILYSF